MDNMKKPLQRFCNWAEILTIPLTIAGINVIVIDVQATCAELCGSKSQSDAADNLLHACTNIGEKLCFLRKADMKLLGERNG